MNKSVIVVPTYNEAEVLPGFLSELVVLLRPGTDILIVDDSIITQQEKIESIVRSCENSKNIKIDIHLNSRKGGRGAAVRRGFQICTDRGDQYKYFLECDSDGSHQPSDIAAILYSKDTEDIVIGSRYITGSKITGWPMSRRIYSRLLNHLVPRLLGIPVADITNGLRRYSRAAVGTLLSTEMHETGFIALSEQAFILHQAKYSFREHPIHFRDRTAGKSSVNSRELFNALTGLRRLIIRKFRKY